MKRWLRKSTKATPPKVADVQPQSEPEPDEDSDAITLSVQFPEDAQVHPNRLPFEGVLTLVDLASDKAPSGARGHKVILTHAAAEVALPGLLGMALDFRDGLDGHDARQKCGVITWAKLGRRKLSVGGFVYGRDYPEMKTAKFEGDLGMSYELADAHVSDMRASIWTITRATFTGAAVLKRDQAAYRNTSFHWLGKRDSRTAPRRRANDSLVISTDEVEDEVEQPMGFLTILCGEGAR